MTYTPESSSPVPSTASVPPVPGRALCPRCGHTIDSWDTFCRYCGRPMKAQVPWYYEPLWIVVLSIAILGPLALPFIWKSPKLTRPAKWVFTFFHIIYAALLVYVLWPYGLYIWRLYSTLTQDFGAFR